MKEDFRPSAGREFAHLASVSFHLWCRASVLAHGRPAEGRSRKGNAMNRKELRAVRTGRAVFVGCQFCGRVDLPLRNYNDGKICVECLKKKKVSNLGTGKEDKHG